MKAVFNDVKSFAIFNAKPHIFQFSSPYQLGSSDRNAQVFIDLISGKGCDFIYRVKQFGGEILND